MSEANLEIVHAGAPRENFEDRINVESKTVLVAFHNFAMLKGLTHVNNLSVISETFHAF